MIQMIQVIQQKNSHLEKTYILPIGAELSPPRNLE